MTDQDIEAAVKETLQAPECMTLGELIDYYALIAANAKHIHASLIYSQAQLN